MKKSIFNKKMSDMTLGETLKVSFWATIISIVLGLLPFGIAALLEGRDKKKALRSAPADDEEEEETSD
jgi:hypothetical protein